MEKIHLPINSMARNKSPILDGVVVELYLFFLEVIGKEFSQMIKAIVQVGQFPKGVNKGMITFLFKAKKKENMGNWCPITLLNVANKIFVKAL